MFYQYGVHKYVVMNAHRDLLNVIKSISKSMWDFDTPMLSDEKLWPSRRADTYDWDAWVTHHKLCAQSGASGLKQAQTPITMVSVCGKISR